MNLEREFIKNLALKNKRSDKRALDQFRELSIEKNPVEKAEGSARVKLGKTDVIVGVKMDVGEPFPDKTDEGILMTGAELSPIASPEFESGPPREKAIELARVVDRGIRESGCIETKKLCIKKKEKVWIVHVDIEIINHDGNLIDVAALAAISALLNTKFPEIEDDIVVNEKKTKKPLPIKFKPIAATFVKMDNKFLLDPNIAEERASDTRLTITTKDDGNVCAMQKGGVGGISPEEVEKLIEISKKKGEEIRKML